MLQGYFLSEGKYTSSRVHEQVWLLGGLTESVLLPHQARVPQEKVHF